MNKLADTHTVSVSIQRDPDEVYAFVGDPMNFPRWSSFFKSARPGPDSDNWIIDTPDGAVRVRFTPKNKFRVLDHFVRVNADLDVYVPMRVLANGPDRSEVIFTVFRLPGMSDHDYETDIGMVRKDLLNLKRVLEHTA